MDTGPWTVDPAHAGRRVDRMLRVSRPDLPYARIQRLFREKQVLVNGRPAAPDHRLRVGDAIAIVAAAGLEPVPANPAVAFDVLHHDEHVLVVAKPSGLAVHPGNKHRTRTLVNGLLSRYGPDLRRLGPELHHGLTHRLDIGTSGVVVVARTAEAHRDLLAQFRRREVRKDYRALVAGRPPRSEWTIRFPLERVQRRGRTWMRVAPAGRGHKAVTGYRTLESFDTMSYLAVEPRTGRTHQIRVHLATLGTPVVGDPLYGSPVANDHARRRLDLRRPFLHALSITFSHPATGRTLAIEAPLPAELAAVLARLREHRG